MIAARHRGMGRKVIDRVLRKGKYHTNSFFKVWHLDKKAGSTQFAVMISSKILRDAVDRNLLRRRIYEIIRQRYTALSLPRYIVISARPSCQNASFQILQAQLGHILDPLLPTTP